MGVWMSSAKRVGVPEQPIGQASGKCLRVRPCVCCWWLDKFRRQPLTCVLPSGSCACVQQAPPSPSTASSVSSGTTRDDDDSGSQRGGFWGCFCRCFSSSPSRGSATHPTSPKVHTVGRPGRPPTARYRDCRCCYDGSDRRGGARMRGWVAISPPVLACRGL